VRRILSIAFLFILFSCANQCPNYPHTNPSIALNSHESSRREIRSIRAEARVEQRGKEGRIRGTVFMFVERENRVRFDVMTQFGPAAILTSDGERFAFADLRKNVFTEGPTCPANIDRLLGVRLSAQQITLLLLGTTPVLENATSQIGCTSDGVYRIVLNAKDGSRQEVDLQPYECDLDARPEKQRLNLLRTELFEPTGKSRWRVTYDDYRTISKNNPDVRLPFWVRIEQSILGTDTVVRFKEVTLNPEIPPGVFTQKPRAGMTREEASCK
jgi:hypothetical protein